MRLVQRWKCDLKKPMSCHMEINEDQLVVISRVVHEAIRAFCMAHGDNSQPPYDKIEDWMREATLQGIRFRLENPSAPNSAQHDQWMQQKMEDGWVHGAVKDGEKKTHPMLIAYEELPYVEKQKDALFAAIVEALYFRQIG
ncbi:RyR domain-containing protein [Parvularcula sp. IMCC14364]|uniref:RyR domain-containing protein n=1 Tax=Parvularcula sp. IMCC14364 TaxID=3067902 RepID=UPI0027422E87|nr:RyR domain-containing protein [Parvularcula sp. IMCC14364]